MPHQGLTMTRRLMHERVKFKSKHLKITAWLHLETYCYMTYLTHSHGTLITTTVSSQMILGTHQQLLCWGFSKVEPMKIAELNQFIITAQHQVQFQTIICLSAAIFLTLFLIAIIYTCSPLNLFALERWPYQARKRMVLHLGPWRSHAWDQFLSQRRCLEVGMRRRITLAAKLQLVSYWKKLRPQHLPRWRVCWSWSH